ncbi:MAG: hypothetical protein E7269_02555 [Lachnospiraceae bacterium]|nr:hypothetical protein [Lachnospiraceae bacterium]
MNKEKNVKKTLRNGGYSLGLCVLMLAIIIVINVVINSLPANFTKFDMTDNDIFTLTETTQGVIEAMEDDVTIYTIAGPGDSNDYMDNYVALYDAASDKIHTETIDPDIDFNFLEEYSVNVTPGSVVVVGTRWACSECGYEYIGAEEADTCSECQSEDTEFTRKHRVIELSDVFINETDDKGNEATTGIDIEGQITTAIKYVSSEYIQTVYYMQGHGEEEEKSPSETFASEVMKLNMDFKYWDMTDTDELPDDCDVLIINGPQTDFNDAETEAILEYLDNGGAALIDVRLNTNEGFTLPNFEKILAAYGIEIAGGGVVESNSNYYFENEVYSIVPRMRSHAITDDLILAETELMLYLADALDTLETVEGKDDISIVPFLQTSSYAYLKERGSVTTQKTEGDRSGTFNLGMAISNPVSEDADTRMVVFSTHYLMMDQTNDNVNGGNYKLLVSAISWLADQEDNISLAAKGLTPDSLILTAAEVNRTAIVVVFVIPFAILIGGFVVWQKRRTR